MQCPRHHVELSQTLEEGHQITRCPTCAGLWIPGHSIDALLGAGEKLKLRSLCSARESKLACPHDGELLGEAIIAGVTLDFCLRCHGLWLDPGELETLRARSWLPSSSRLAGARRAEGEIGLSGVETVLWVLEGVITLLAL